MSTSPERPTARNRTPLVDACEDGATVDQLKMGYLGISLLEASEVVQELIDVAHPADTGDASDEGVNPRRDARFMGRLLEWVVTYPNHTTSGINRQILRLELQRVVT